MFKELFKIFSDDTLLDAAFKRSHDMLLVTREMFEEARTSLRTKDVNQVDINIYDKDIEVNKFEREVRRNVLNHLTVSGCEEIYSSLVLVSIIIDIERIGDYTKNVLELAMNHPARLNGGAFEDDLSKIEAAVLDSFDRVPRQFKKSDSADAEKMLTEYRWVNQVCTQHANDYVKNVDKSVETSDAVALALYFRYLKRINSHLRNIATSVVNPFDQIGFTHKLDKKK